MRGLGVEGSKGWGLGVEGWVIEWGLKGRGGGWGVSTLDLLYTPPIGM